MKCNQCDAEVTGKFCPECGTKMMVETPIQSPPVEPVKNRKKRKTSFFANFCLSCLFLS